MVSKTSTMAEDCPMRSSRPVRFSVGLRSRSLPAEILLARVCGAMNEHLQPVDVDRLGHKVIGPRFMASTAVSTEP